MSTYGNVLTATLVFAVPGLPLGMLSAAGCSDRKAKETPDSDFKIVEGRIPACQKFCESELNPECPNPNFASLSLHECMNLCPSTRPEWSRQWAPSSDGAGDRCAIEAAAKIECFASLTCEQRNEFDFESCVDEKNLLSDCLQSGGEG